MKTVYAMLAMAVAVAFSMPVATADHGLYAVYVSEDGSELWVAQYVGGTGADQTWQFDGAGGSCSATGNVEVGFSGTCFTSAGTGVDVPYMGPCTGVDAQPDTVNGKAGLVVVAC